jgi:hypothetical protein
VTDDEKPATRWVRIGYALTGDGQLDTARIGRVEELPAADAKALVKGGRAQYVDGPDPVAETAEANAQQPVVAERPAGVWGGPKQKNTPVKTDAEEKNDGTS